MIRVVRQIGRSSRGQGLVEFALAFPIVLFVIFGVFEFGRYYYTRLTMQHAVAEATRFAITGNVLSDSLGDPMSRVASIVEVIRTRASTLEVDVDRITILPADGGGPGDVVTVNAAFGFQFIVPGYRQLAPEGVLDFTVSTSMRNERFFTKGE